MAKKTTSTSAVAKHAASVSAAQAVHGIGGLTPAFITWCEAAHGIPAAESLAALEPVKSFVADYVHVTADSLATGFEAGPFAHLLGKLLEELESGGDEDELTFVCDSIRIYIEFLGATALWSGSDKDFNTINGLFHGDDGLSGGLPGVVAPVLTAAQESAGLAGTVLAQRLTALLEWIGTGKDVTATGTLRLKDLGGAAAAIGVAVKGASPIPPATQATLFDYALDEPGIESGHVRAIKEMNDEPKLVLFWTALQSARLIELGATRASLTSKAEKFLAGGADHPVAVLREVTAKIVKAVVIDEEASDPWSLQASMAMTALLVAVSHGAPLPIGTFRAMLPATGDSIGGDIVRGIVLGSLNYLVELGLLHMDTHVQVPPAVVGCVAEALDDVLGFGDGPRYEVDAPAVERPRARTKAKKSTNAAIYQVKVQIQRASPPVWRRLLVHSRVTLGELHHIIQNSFEWDDSHLHFFQVGGRHGTSYGPPDAESYVEDLDENAHALGEVLAAEGDSMLYNYDFGDDWQHKITVEKVLPDDPKAATVRCTGGRGMGPAEDSGGVRGWTSMVDSVNDPGHPEHEDCRDWLGLPPGEKLDPKHFDRVDLNGRLTEMF